MATNEPTRAWELLAQLSQTPHSAAQPANELLVLLYDELKALAHSKMAREPRGHTLQATALVHEAYMRLVGEHDPGWSGRAHFLGAAAEAMRRILVERARAKGRLKRGADRQRVELSDVATLGDAPDPDVLELDALIERLAAQDARKARVVVLRHFGGLELEETAAALGVSVSTVKSDWNYALAWLHRELSR